MGSTLQMFYVVYVHTHGQRMWEEQRTYIIPGIPTGNVNTPFQVIYVIVGM